MSNINFLIFDFDGTLVNSMFMWKNFSEFYLRSKNIQNINYNNVSKILSKMSLFQSAIYLKKKYFKNQTIQKVYLELYSYLEEFYLNFVYLKIGVKEFLHKNSDKRMCIASESEKKIIIKLLKKFNIYKFFEFVITSSDVNSTKQDALIYKKCMEKLNCNINNTILFEDALYAIHTANKINLKTVCILDQYSNELNINNVLCWKVINNFYELEEL